MRRKGGLGWIPAVAAHGFTTPEEQFWSSRDFAGLVVYDLGAFEGLLTIFLALRAKSVVCCEPKVRNRKRLIEKVTLNHLRNVEVRAVGVGSRDEVWKMIWNPLMPGDASVDEQAAEQLLCAGMKAEAEEISIVPLDEGIASAHLPPPDLIKIDVEGWELEGLRGARETLGRYRPALFIELHGQTIREKERRVSDVVRFLWDLNYHNVLHVETGATILPENAIIASQGHLYCRPCSASATACHNH